MQLKKSFILSKFILILIILFIMAGVYGIIQLVSFLLTPTKFALVKNGELVKYEAVEGYIIRDEEVLDLSSYDGKLDAAIPDASRVAAGGTIIYYVSESQDELISKIDVLDEQIQKALENQSLLYPSDVKALNTAIEFNLNEIRNFKNDVYELSEYKDLINKNIEKKAKIVGELSPTGSAIKELISERLGYENRLNDGRSELVSDNAGLVSYRVDNYENILTPNSFSALSISELESFKINANQLISINTEKVKIIDNFVTYIAVPIYSEDAKNITLNSTMKLKLGENSDYVKATVIYITDENDARLVIFKIADNVEELTKYRKIAFELVWWSDSGLKVPNDAINSENVLDALNGNVIGELDFVFVKKAGYNQKVWVKVIREADNFAIIENYSDEELLEMGMNEEFVNNNVTIELYDEVVLDG